MLSTFGFDRTVSHAVRPSQRVLNTTESKGYASGYSSSAVAVDSVPAAFFIKYALMN